MPENAYALDPKPVPCPLCGGAVECLAHRSLHGSVTQFEARPLHAVQHIRRGQYLFRAGDPLKGLFVIRTGCFKVYALDPVGREYIAGFRLPPSLLGMHGLYNGHHQFNALALTESQVCGLAPGALQTLSAQIPSFQVNLLRTIGEELVDSTYLTGELSAEERLVSFLLRLASKLHADGNNGTLYLYMSRGDIATYLRLAQATVSRILTSLRERGLIDSDYHHIYIRDYARLEKLGRNTRFLSL